MDMHIFLTGGSGFIGSYLIDELLQHGHTITALIHKNPIKNEKVTSIQGNLQDLSSLLKAMDDPQIDACIHNAAFATDFASPKELNQANHIGTKNIFESCQQHQIQDVVYTSTAGVYGFPNNNNPITEDAQKKPFTPYQKSKYYGELEIKNYPDLNISSIRPPLIFGPTGKPIQVLYNQLKSGHMKFVGKGTNNLPIVHPSDVAQLIRLATEQHAKGPYNAVSCHTTPLELSTLLCEGFSLQKPTTHVPYFLAMLVASINETTQKHPSITRFQVKSLGTTRKISNDKAKNDLNYAPRYPTIEKLAQDIIENFQA